MYRNAVDKLNLQKLHKSFYNGITNIKIYKIYISYVQLVNFTIFNLLLNKIKQSQHTKLTILPTLLLGTFKTCTLKPIRLFKICINVDFSLKWPSCQVDIPLSVII